MPSIRAIGYMEEPGSTTMRRQIANENRKFSEENA
jgi:hypothetical protein